MLKPDERFEKIYAQGAFNVTELWLDRETGGNISVSFQRLCRRHNAALKLGWNACDYETSKRLTSG